MATTTTGNANVPATSTTEFTTERTGENAGDDI